MTAGTSSCAADQWDVLHNDFKLFTLSAITPDTGGPAIGAQYAAGNPFHMSAAMKSSVAKSLKRCAAFGVSESSCVPTAILQRYRLAR